MCYICIHICVYIRYYMQSYSICLFTSRVIQQNVVSFIVVVCPSCDCSISGRDTYKTQVDQHSNRKRIQRYCTLNKIALRVLHLYAAHIQDNRMGNTTNMFVA